MSTVRSIVFWGIGLVAAAATAWIDGSAAILGPWYSVGAAATAGILVAAWAALRRKPLLDAAAIVSVVTFVLAGPRPGASAIVSASALALLMAAYFMLRLETRINEDGQDTTEGRLRSHQAVSFASRRILLVVSVSAAATALLLHLPLLVAPWVSPRWAVSIDATSTPVLLVFAIPYMAIITAWTLIRLGRPVPGPFQESSPLRTDEVQSHD